MPRNRQGRRTESAREPRGCRELARYEHQSNLSRGDVPLMVIDAWEHARLTAGPRQRATGTARPPHFTDRVIDERRRAEVERAP